MERKLQSKEKEFFNVRVKADRFRIISDFAFSQHLNLARCVEEALEDFIEKHRMEETS